MRVFVADDHPLYREALTRAIGQRAELELVGDSGDGREALAAIRRLEPDVAVVDGTMPGLEGADVAHALVRDGVDTAVLLLSGYLEGPRVYRALASGARGYLSKDASGDAICDAVVAVARGETVLPPETHAAIADEIRQRGAAERPALSPREREILALIADGLSAPEVAARLHLSTGTVKSHLQHLYEKLGVSDRAAAVAEAMRRRLLE